MLLLLEKLRRNLAIPRRLLLKLGLHHVHGLKLGLQHVRALTKKVRCDRKSHRLSKRNHQRGLEGRRNRKPKVDDIRDRLLCVQDAVQVQVRPRGLGMSVVAMVNKLLEKLMLRSRTCLEKLGSRTCVVRIHRDLLLPAWTSWSSPFHLSPSSHLLTVLFLEKKKTKTNC